MADGEVAALPGEEAACRLRESGIALIPVGAVEAHGPHLPVGTDNYLAAALARQVAEEADAVVLPLVPYGPVWSLGGFPGSLGISAAVLTGLLCDLGRGLRRHGVPVIGVISGHIGNAAAMKDAARILYGEGGPVMYCLTYPGLAEAARQVCTSERFHGGYFHADEIETSLMLWAAPEHVRMDRAIRGVPKVPPDFDYRPVPWAEISRTAVMGDATVATVDKGRALMAAVVARTAELLRQARAQFGKEAS